jgi:hypothetical protein
MVSEEKIGLKDVVYELPFNHDDENHFACFEKIEDLISYTQGRECDWCDKITGPKNRKVYYPQGWYEKMTELLKTHEYVYYIKIVRDFTEDFEFALGKTKLEIIEADYE